MFEGEVNRRLFIVFVVELPQLILVVAKSVEGHVCTVRADKNSWERQAIRKMSDATCLKLDF